MFAWLFGSGTKNHINKFKQPKPFYIIRSPKATTLKSLNPFGIKSLCDVSIATTRCELGRLARKALDGNVSSLSCLNFSLHSVVLKMFSR